MELNDLTVFQRVAFHGSVSKAAEELNYVQSNVTARIKHLETELGTSLFYRHRRGMTLTAEGKKLIEYAAKVMASVEELKRAFQDAETPTGVLEIGTVEIVNWLPRILSAYHQQYPGVDLSLKAGVTEQLIKDVLDYKLDGAFISGPIRHPLIEQYMECSEELVVVSKRETLTMEELTHTPLLLFNKGCGYRAKLGSWFRREGILPKQVMEFASFETIIGSVAAGLGISIVPRSTVRYMEQNGLLFCHAIPEEHRMISTVFIRRKDSHMTSSIRKFIETLQTTPLIE
ncbi:LysR family transcriptional regulator [Brevibacillus fluminis]|uniref:LysR family transcriptional regulator n=1 Tax=Brevibacillus fluminis TaxID=511487 RepID=UPI003F88872A